MISYGFKKRIRSGLGRSFYVSISTKDQVLIYTLVARGVLLCSGLGVRVDVLGAESNPTTEQSARHTQSSWILALDKL